MTAPRPRGCFQDRAASSPGMAQALFESEPVFRETVQRCVDVLEGVLPRSLLEVMFDTGPDGEEALRDTIFAQPALFAVEMALGQVVAVVGRPARCGGGAQRRPVRGGVCRRRLRHRRWSAADRGTWPPVRLPCPQVAA